MIVNPLVSQLPHRTLPVGGWVNNCAQPVHVCVEEGHMMGKSKIKKTQDCFLVPEHYYQGHAVGG